MFYWLNRVIVREESKAKPTLYICLTDISVDAVNEYGRAEEKEGLGGKIRNSALDTGLIK